jgi:hypothetical protein
MKEKLAIKNSIKEKFVKTNSEDEILCCRLNVIIAYHHILSSKQKIQIGKNKIRKIRMELNYE